MEAARESDEDESEDESEESDANEDQSTLDEDASDDGASDDVGDDDDGDGARDDDDDDEVSDLASGGGASKRSGRSGDSSLHSAASKEAKELSLVGAASNPARYRLGVTIDKAKKDVSAALPFIDRYFAGPHTMARWAALGSYLKPLEETLEKYTANNSLTLVDVGATQGRVLPPSQRGSRSSQIARARRETRQSPYEERPWKRDEHRGDPTEMSF